MKNESLLNEKLKEINSILQWQYTTVADVGVMAGLSGIALFQFYYSKYLDVDEHSDIGIEMISNCIEKINDGYSTPTFCSGIAGLGWTIQHLKTSDFIDIDCDSLLSQFDDYLFDQMLSDFNQGYYDFMHGALGYAFFFLIRFKHTEDEDLKKRYQSYLSESINSLGKLCISKDNVLKWKSDLDIVKSEKVYDLSLSHGISSIINFLSRLHDIDIFKKETKELILGGSNYILSFENSNRKNISLFPNWIEKETPPQYNSRIAWCYGDLGIGLSLLRAGKSLEDIPIRNKALEILGFTTRRNSLNDTFVYDAGVCHGSYGNALIYKRLFQTSDDISFKKSLDFWIEDGIQKAIHEDGYAGYKQWNAFKKNWTPKLSLLEGIAGIGLVIIDYLSNEPNSWDECLMIS